MNKELGYTKPLFILAFDHRSSFLKKMFGVKDREPTAEETAKLSELKKVIYEGFKQAVESGHVPREYAAVLVDEQFGAEILRDAKASGLIFCKSAEKSGQDEFDFEYGDDWQKHIEDFDPTFVKVLIRYNPDADKDMNARQRGRLKILSDYCHAQGYKFLIEPLIPGTPEQLAQVGDDQKRYDEETRPGLMVKMIAQLQADGIEPDIWKIEGLKRPAHYGELVKQAQGGGRNDVGAVVLGRGADMAQVETWLKAGASVPGMRGFAIGRTIFWDALMGLHEGKLTREQAVAEIAKHYIHFYEVFTNAAK